MPRDLQATVLATAKHIEHEITPCELDMLVRQRKNWLEKGGDLIALSPTDKADLMAKTGTIGDGIVKPEQGRCGTCSSQRRSAASKALPAAAPNIDHPAP